MGMLNSKKKEYSAADSQFKVAIKLFDDNPIHITRYAQNQIECLRGYAELLRAENQPAQAKEMDALADKIKL